MISEPDDDNVTICEGEEGVFTCVLNVNIGYYVQWYRYITDTGTTELVYPSGVKIFIHTQTGNIINSSLTITNTRKSYTGYYWVGTSSLNIYNASLTVTASIYVDS